MAQPIPKPIEERKNVFAKFKIQIILSLFYFNFFTLINSNL